MVFGADLRPKLVGRIDRRIHIAPEPLLRFGQGVGNGLKWHITDDEQVDVAVGPQLAPGCRAEHEGDEDAVSDRCQRLAQDVRHAGGLEKNRLELLEYRRLLVRLEVHLPSLDGASNQPGAGQEIELSLYSALPDPCVAHDLAQIEGFAGMPEQPAQDASPRAAEEHGRGFIEASLGGCRCTQLEYKCTHCGYQGQAGERVGAVRRAGGAKDDAARPRGRRPPSPP